MAPGKVEKKKKKPSELSKADVRRALQQRATSLREKAESDEETANSINQLERILEQPDDKFDTALAQNQLEALGDIEMEDAPGTPQDQQSDQVTEGENKGSEESQESAAETNQSQKEGDGIDSEITIKSEEKDENPLFVSQYGSEKDERKPDGATTGISAAAKSSNDSEYGEALFQTSVLSHGEQIKTVGWIGGNSKQYMNRYGPKNAGRYRIDGFSDSSDYMESMNEKISLSPNRLGEELDKVTGKLKYTKRHIRGLYGVGWKGVEDKNDAAEDLRLLDPKEVAEKKADRTMKKIPSVYVLVAWDKEGETVYRWETRAALRARWGTKAADKYIYQAACEQEERYMEYTTGKREALSRSPSVGLARKDVDKEREKSLAAATESGQRSSTVPASPRSPLSIRPTPVSGRARSPKSNVSKETKVQWADTLETFKTQFQAEYCEWSGARNFRELTPEDKADFLGSWLVAKTNWEATRA